MFDSLPRSMAVVAIRHSPTTFCLTGVGTIGNFPARTLGLPLGCFTLTRLGHGGPDRNPSIVQGSYPNKSCVGNHDKPRGDNVLLGPHHLLAILPLPTGSG
eukprot:10857300-Heterocapsa_arctica.AAC.1